MVWALVCVSRYGRCVSTSRWRCQQIGAISQQDLHLAHLGTPWALAHFHLLPYLEACAVNVHEVGSNDHGGSRVAPCGVAITP